MTYKTLVAVVLIGSILGAHLMRSRLARSHAGIVAYYSLYPRLFSYGTSYTTGTVGPFALGATKDEAISQLDSSGRSFRFPMRMSSAQLNELYFKESSHVSQGARLLLEQQDEWRVAMRQEGATVVYRLSFNRGRLMEVHLASTLIV